VRKSSRERKKKGAAWQHTSLHEPLNRRRAQPTSVRRTDRFVQGGRAPKKEGISTRRIEECAQVSNIDEHLGRRDNHKKNREKVLRCSGE
jgi:hypothetical protein